MQKENGSKKDKRVSIALSTPRTLYIRDYIYAWLKRVANKTYTSPSQLTNRFLLKALKDGNWIPTEEYGMAEKLLNIDRNMRMERKLFTWLKQIRRSGAWAEKELKKILEEGEPTSEECEAYKRIFQQRDSLTSENISMIREVFQDLGTFKIDAYGERKRKPSSSIPNNPANPSYATIPNSLNQMFNMDSPTPFTDWVSGKDSIPNTIVPDSLNPTVGR